MKTLRLHFRIGNVISGAEEGAYCQSAGNKAIRQCAEFSDRKGLVNRTGCRA
jgi:hypothetical protein